MAPSHYPLNPNTHDQPTSIRKIYIQNLVDLLHACLARGEIERAKRAWSILTRCREVDWKLRWRWGLALISTCTDLDAHHDHSRQLSDVEQWLRSLRVTISQQEKPAVLHALILHLIRSNQHREALEELETYLTSYPYLLSGPLHTYAGLLAFYLAQPADMRVPFAAIETDGAEGTGLGFGDDSMYGRRAGSGLDSDMSSPGFRRRDIQPPNQGLLRQARGWFVKALEIADDQVASEFIRIIDTGDITSARSDTFSERDSPIPVPHASIKQTYEMHESDRSESDLEDNSQDEDDEDEGEMDSDGSIKGLDIEAMESDGAADEDEIIDSVHEDEDD